MKSLELRRHTDNDDDQLTAEGIAGAQDIAKRLSPPYDAFVSTGAQRSIQTLEIWRAAVGGAAPVEDEPGLRSQQEERWKKAYRVAGSAELARLRAADPDLVEDDSVALGTALERVFDRLPDGGRALVCGHSPTNEAAVLGLTGQLIEPLDKGAGVRVVQADNGGYRVEALG